VANIYSLSLSQEKVYNPFYTVVGQHLCRDGAGSLSFQITLQYCLWDFLRDIGEKEVGGAGMIANLDTSRSFDEANHITGSVLRVQNVANAYAWWVAKGSLSVSILKVRSSSVTIACTHLCVQAIRFGTLREPGQSFFETFFAQLFISIHSASPLQSYSKLSSIPFSRDSGRVEAIFIKAIAQHNMLGADIYHFLSKARTRWGDSAKSEEVTEFLDWSCEVVKQTIRDCLDL
jgi:nucleolar MIF4G domain-containing protein 1